MPSADVSVAEAIHQECSPSDYEALVAMLYDDDGYETRVKPQGPEGGFLKKFFSRWKSSRCQTCVVLVDDRTETTR